MWLTKKLIDTYYQSDVTIIQSRKHFASSFLFFPWKILFLSSVSVLLGDVHFLSFYCLLPLPDSLLLYLWDGMGKYDGSSHIKKEEEEGSRSCLIHI